MESLLALKAPPVVDLDPYDADVLQCPDDFFAALREAGAVVWLEKYKCYAVGRETECRTVLADYARFTTTGGIGLGDARKPGVMSRPLSELLEVDPPAHTPVRSTVQRILSPAAMKAWRAEFDISADQLVKSLMGREINAMSDLIEAFIFEVFPRALGIRFDPEAVRAIGVLTFNQSGPPNARYDTAVLEAEPFMKWMLESCERENVVPGTVAEQFFIAEDEGRLRKGIAANLVRALIRGGTDSTIAGIGSLVKQLAITPGAWDKLKAQPAKIKIALDEAVRLETPFNYAFRTTLGATELAGYALEADTKIGVFFGSANRDPAIWDRPEVFDLDRRVAGQHLGFGTADHNCIGANLARMESEAIVGAMLRHCTAIESVGPVTYRTINQMRMIENLPIRLV